MLDARRKQKPLRTPGTNRKVWISGALNFHTGRLHWVVGEHRAGELFIRLLDHLRKTYRCHKQLHLAVDNDSSHVSKRVKDYVEDSAGRVRLHPLPSWSPESNPVELVWWSLHDAVSRNHECAGLDDLVDLAESYLEKRQPFKLKLGKVYEQLERPPPRDRSVHLRVKVALDDFGTGFSSLSYLKRLPADAIKIDGSFVKGFGEDVEDTAIVRMIVELAHTLGVEVVAEGVESEEQARQLREIGCDMAQGFHFSKPLPPEEIPALFSSDTPT